MDLLKKRIEDLEFKSSTKKNYIKAITHLWKEFKIPLKMDLELENDLEVR